MVAAHLSCSPVWSSTPPDSTRSAPNPSKNTAGNPGTAPARIWFIVRLAVTGGHAGSPAATAGQGGVSASPPPEPSGPVAGAVASYGVLADGTAHEIDLCAATRRYTRSPTQATPRQPKERRQPAGGRQPAGQPAFGGGGGGGLSPSASGCVCVKRGHGR
jgi:hypothetical protein